MNTELSGLPIWIQLAVIAVVVVAFVLVCLKVNMWSNELEKRRAERRSSKD